MRKSAANFSLVSARGLLFGVGKKVQMSAVRALLRLLMLLLSGAGVGAQNPPLFFVVGNTIKLSLDPPAAGEIGRIEWLHNLNFVAGWTKGVFECNEKFKNRTEVNKATGLLEIRKGTAGDSGKYEVEVNNRLQVRVYQVEVIKTVPKPSVWIQPLSCGPRFPRCNLTCEGSTEGAGAVTYSWTRGDEGWKQEKRVLVITNETAKVRTFSCRMENGVSKEESDPKDNPFFFQEEKPTNTSAIVGICVVVVVFIIVGLVIYYCWNKIRGCFSPGSWTQPPVEDTEGTTEQFPELNTFIKKSESTL